MRRVCLVGLGRIARTFLSLRNAEDETKWMIAGALKRQRIDEAQLGFPVVTTLAELGALQPDLLIDFTGASALRSNGPDLLRVAELWTAGASALVDRDLEERLLATAQQTGHRLRILPGAIGGIDALAAMALDPGASIALTACSTAHATPTGKLESARQVVRENQGINVVAAAALAGHGLDRTLVDHARLAANDQRRFLVEADGAFGALRLSIDPVLDPERGTLIVAASAMVALRNAFRPIWVG